MSFPFKVAEHGNVTYKGRPAQYGDSDAKIIEQIKSLRAKAPLQEGNQQNKKIEELISKYLQRHAGKTREQVLEMTNNAYLVNLED